MRIYVTIGYKEVEEGKPTRYYGDYSDNGEFYKDLEAWRKGEGVIYIGEYELGDYQEGDKKESELWTKDSWIEWVRNFVRVNYASVFDWGKEAMNDTDFIESLAYDCLYNSDWQDLSTILEEFDYNGDWVEACWEEHIK